MPNDRSFKKLGNSSLTERIKEVIVGSNLPVRTPVHVLSWKLIISANSAGERIQSGLAESTQFSLFDLSVFPSTVTCRTPPSPTLVVGEVIWYNDPKPRHHLLFKSVI